MEKDFAIELSAEQKKALADHLKVAFDDVAIRVEYSQVPAADAESSGHPIAALPEKADGGNVWIVDSVRLAPRGGDVGLDLGDVAGGMLGDDADDYRPARRRR